MMRDGSAHEAIGRLVDALSTGDAPMEIERKYLVEMPSGEWLAGHSTGFSDIVQTYLSVPNLPGETRVRRRERDGKAECVVTNKQEAAPGGVSRLEAEVPVSEQEAEALLAMRDPQARPVRKTRHLIPSGDLVFELDLYPFDSRNAILEVELPSEDAPFAIPEGLVVVGEVTGNPALRNAGLARRTRDRLRTLAGIR